MTALLVEIYSARKTDKLVGELGDISAPPIMPLMNTGLKCKSVVPRFPLRRLS